MLLEPGSKEYYFETSDPVMADKFLKVISNMRIPLEDTYIAAKYFDYSQIQFRCSRKKRLEVEYVFRNYIHLDHKYLWDIDTHESSLELTGMDGYVIY